MNGRVYEVAVTAEELAALGKRHTVLQAILFEGKNRARIYEPGDLPPVGAEPVTATLEDAYLLLMRRADQADQAPRGDTGLLAAGSPS